MARRCSRGRRRFETCIDEEIIAAIEELARRERKRVNKVIEEALKTYLELKKLLSSGS